MKTELRSKLFDGLASPVILMLIMFPLIMLFRPLPAWGTPGYLGVTALLFVAAIWCLYRATLEKLSPLSRGWYGLVGGLCGWTVSELSHEIGLIDIERADILLVLLLGLAVLAVLWKYIPKGAHFWIVIFLMNWIGHVFIHVTQEYFAGSPADTIFTVTAAAYGLLIIGLLYWIFVRSQHRVQRLWLGLWIWHALAMIYFLLR